jgi:predicted transcriptional regulator
MAKHTTVRLPDELADKVDAVARAKGKSVNQLIIDSLTAEIDRVRDDKDFLATLKRLVDRDQEILDRLAQ